MSKNEYSGARIGNLVKIFLILIIALFLIYFFIRFGYELIYQIIIFFGVHITPTEYSNRIIVPLELLPSIIGIIFALFIVLLIMNILRKLGAKRVNRMDVFPLFLFPLQY